MSQANVEVVRKAFEAWNAGDMDALAALYDPDMVVRGPEEWPEPGPFVGRDAIMRQYRQVRETFDSDELIPSDIIDFGDRVLVKAAWHGIGHGPTLAMEWTQLFTLRRGKIVLLEYFHDHDEALNAAELSD
jgi:ketosteroid isomerase-like protein